MRNKFDEQLKILNNKLIEMGGLVECAIEDAYSAFENHDKEQADKAITFDAEVDRMEKEVEQLCLKLLLRQQPVARDLRLISAALKMITDIERIGDQAADISEIAINFNGTEFFGKLPHIHEMADATIKMVNDSIDAFVKRDLQLAFNVIKYDDKVDDLFCQVRTELIDLIKEDSSQGDMIIDLIMVTKYFERIGDHAENIAEWVVFSITGEHENG